MNYKVDEFISNATQWQAEYDYLRMILLDCGLTEDFKWAQPCYTSGGKNIVILAGFKNHCALGFFKGSLIEDSENLLTKPGENTQEGRQMRFKDINQIIALEPQIKAYIFEAIEVEKAGLKVPVKQVHEFEVPEELVQKFNEMPELKQSFQSLTPGRQKAYLMHFSQAKQSKTRLDRIENYIPRILNRKGITDCVCGFSHKMPGCDGTHKHFGGK